MQSLPFRAFYFVNITKLPEYTLSCAHCIIKLCDNLAVFEAVLETAASIILSMLEDCHCDVVARQITLRYYRDSLACLVYGRPPTASFC
jgi:hypothetical protein